MNTTLPAPVALDTPQAATLASYGDPLLRAIARRADAQGALHEGGAAGLIDALARLALALQAADPASLRRQAGWWGRLLGRDVERQRDADALQPQLGVLLLQAEACAARVQAAAAQRQAAVATSEQAAAALQQWVDAGSQALPGLPGGDGGALQGVLAQRLDHLRRLAALQRNEAAQWQLLLAQDEALLARFRRIADILLPAWRQATLARHVKDQAQRSQRAAQLQAEIAAEVASAQARLR